MAAAEPVMDELVDMALDRTLDPVVQLRAIESALDRAGLSAKNSIELTVDAPWQHVIADIVAEVPDDQIDAGRLALAGPPPSPRPHEAARAYTHDEDDLPGVVDGEVIEALTRDSEQSDDSSTGFEGPNRLLRTPEVHDDHADRQRPARRARRRHPG